jgi:hypothetical protein
VTDLETISRLRLVVNNDRLEHFPERITTLDRAVFFGALIGIVAAVVLCYWLFTTAMFSLA